MNKEVISEKQGISLVIIFIMGSASVMVTGLEAKQDAWIAIIFAIVFSIPMILIYAHIQSLFPGKNLFEIIEISLGKVIGKIIVILFTWYVIDTGAQVLRNYCQFIEETTLSNTPLIVIIILISIPCIYVLKKGIEVIGRVG